MNVPNTLSIFRMILVPIFVVVFFLGGEYAYYYAAGIYALAGITDVLDGYIARKFNQITRLGTIIDPLADKLMTITVFICITIAGIIPWWAIILLLSKDLVLVLGGMRLFREAKNVFSANIFGKTATAFLVLGGIVLMVLNVTGSMPKWTNVYLCIAIALSFIALISYICQYIKYKRGKNNATTTL